MQTANLPTPISGASPKQNTGAPVRNAGADDSGQFSQALSRQIDQRQSNHAAAAKPQVPAKAAQQPKPAAANEPKAAASAPAKPDAPATDETEAAPQDTPATPMAELMALVASFNIPVQAAAASGAGVPATVAASAPALTVPAADADADAAALAALGQAGDFDAADDAELATELARGAALKGSAAEAPAAQAASVPGMLSTLAGQGAAAGLAQPGARKAQGAGAARLGEELDTTGGQRLDPGKPGVTDERALLGETALPTQKISARGQADAEPLLAGALRHRQGASDAFSVKDLAGQASAPGSAAAPFATGLAQALHGMQGAPGEKIAARVGTSAWDNQLGQKIVWMVAGKEQSASLTLNPPDMGPMQVVLSVTNDHATVSFTAAQPEVRQALENAMPRLREMMSESGISLGDASVSDGSAGQRQEPGEPGEPGRQTASAALAERNGSAAQASARAAARAPASAGLGTVDTFA